MQNLAKGHPAWVRQDWESLDDYTDFLAHLVGGPTSNKAIKNLWDERSAAWVKAGRPRVDRLDDPLCWEVSGDPKRDQARARRRLASVAVDTMRAIREDMRAWATSATERRKAIARLNDGGHDEVVVPDPHKPSPAALRAIPDLIQVELAIRDGLAEED